MGGLLTASLISSLAGGGGIIAYEVYKFNQNAIQDLNATATMLSSSVSGLMQQDKRAEATQALNTLAGYPHILAAGLYNYNEGSDNLLIARYLHPSSSELVPLVPRQLRHHFEGGTLILFRPIENEGKRVGVLYLKADLKGALNTNYKRYANIAAIVILVSSLASLFISFALQRIIIRPVQELGAAARALTDRHDFSVRVIPKGQDEMGALMRAFNEMVGTISRRNEELRAANTATEESNHRLQEANSTLETKVRERTVELEQATMDAQKARNDAEEASQSKSAFLANMSHELRTPLNAIIGYSEMLMEETADMGEEAMEADLKNIHSAGKHLLSLINDILDLSKIEAGKITLYLEEFSVDDLVKEVTATIQPLLEKNNNNITVKCDAALGSMTADLTKVRQSLFNLLSNACKFTKQGTITLQAQRQSESDREWINLSVSDTGIGLLPEQMERLFQPFVQADAGTTKKFGGTGLGLAITRRFCRLMGGDALVSSEYGKGSTFTLRLPSVCQPATEGEENATTEPARNRATLPKDASRILVVDDDPVVHDLMKRFLEKEGYRVETAKGGKDGLRMAREFKPDVITLDVMMPDMDGWTVLNALKADPEVAKIPVIMLSMIEDRHMGFALGASEYLTKPIQRDQLSTLLKKYRKSSQHSEVLLVDDDEETRRILRAILTKEGWQVSEASNGHDAVEKLEQGPPPSLIMLDMMMPEMNGFEFLEYFRQQPEWQSIPVVVVTGMEMTDAEHQRLQGLVETVVQKGSCSPEALAQQVRDLVKKVLPKPNS